MARLQPGENAKIDNINRLVSLVQTGSDKESNESLTALLDLFNPLLLKICTKWSNYFNDREHRIIQFGNLMADAQYWFYHYTKEVYDVNGKATYNKFIKDHIDQRIRYIYECEIKYHGKMLFPDPYKDAGDTSGILDDIVNKYSGRESDDIESDMIDGCICDAKTKLVDRIMFIIDSEIFNERERAVFKAIVCDQRTHEELGKEYGVSRTRITQILAKAKSKLYKQIEGDDVVWGLLDDADIDITNPKLGG